jgi:hypothetical protein
MNAFLPARKRSSQLSSFVSVGWCQRSTHHSEDLIICQAGILAQVELPELLDPPDDSDAPAPFVQHVLLRARPLARGDLVLLAGRGGPAVVGGRELDIRPPHHAVLLPDAVGEIEVRRSWDAALGDLAETVCARQRWSRAVPILLKRPAW